MTPLPHPSSATSTLCLSVSKDVPQSVPSPFIEFLIKQIGIRASPKPPTLSLSRFSQRRSLLLGRSHSNHQHSTVTNPSILPRLGFFFFLQCVVLPKGIPCLVFACWASLFPWLLLPVPTDSQIQSRIQSQRYGQPVSNLCFEFCDCCCYLLIS